MKIVWLCSVSNTEIRSKLETTVNPLEPFLWKAVHRKMEKGIDSGIWITNGINEIKNMPEVDLHIVSPCRNLSKMRQDFDIDGVHYHFCRDENSSIFMKIYRYLFSRNSSQFKTNRRRICKIINDINPDLVHVIGAENPQYSLSLLDLPKNIPTILQLQALLMSIKDKVNGEAKINYTYKAEIEKELIKRTDYVGTNVSSYISYIRKNVSDEIKFLNTSLAMAQKIDLSETKKEFDFVHYANELSEKKATDMAIRAFGEAFKANPNITLDLIGTCQGDFKQRMDKLIEELGITGAVTFEGRLPTHDDVIKQIRKARFALLPLSVSIVPNTLHEAMANGLPLITTVTSGTPNLNKKRQSVLISEKGDYKDIAKNMLLLLSDSQLAETLRVNAAQTETERSNNTDIIRHWVNAYSAILKHKKDKEPIPESFFL